METNTAHVDQVEIGQLASQEVIEAYGSPDVGEKVPLLQDVKTTVYGTGQPVDLTGIEIKSISVMYKRIWKPAEYESFGYDLRVEAGVKPGQDPMQVALTTAQSAKDMVHLSAMQELELCGRLKPHVSRAFAGSSIKISDSAVEGTLPTGVTPALHWFAAQVTEDCKEQVAREFEASRAGQSLR